MAVNNSIDDEWEQFIKTSYNDNNNNYIDDMNNNSSDEFNEGSEELNSTISHDIPEPSEIYISTKSKIAYLDKSVDLKIFWDIPVIPYATAKNGVIKKQIKINSKTPEELQDVQNKVQDTLYCEQYIMSHIDNPSGRIKFKDIRKISIGISKKDIMSYRSKKKQAFYNCFVIIFRIKISDVFKEFHIKVFNTGKLEIPGVQSEEMFACVSNHIIDLLQPYYTDKLSFIDKNDTVLINSNFNCGFYINREVLYDLLRNKYNIQSIYDPCSYPGIQCKFYYKPKLLVQTGIPITDNDKDKHKDVIDVSFMIFRTGSVLIVGMCDENVLYEIYEFLKNILKTEFQSICQKIISQEDIELNEKRKKLRRKTIQIINY